MSEGAPAVPSDGSSAVTGPAPRELLTIEIGSTASAVVATVRGELDQSTAPKLISRVQGSIEPGQDLVIDAGGLTFCGSAGLSALIVIERSVTGSGGSLAVVRPTPFLVQLLEMAGLDGLVAEPPAT